MLINFKGQVDVKVRKGQSEKDGNRMMHELAEEVNRVIDQFLRDNGQPEGGYTWLVSRGNALMKI